jgi:hypothetical protein
MQHSEVMIDHIPAVHLLYTLEASVIIIALFKSKYHMDKPFTGLGNVRHPLPPMANADHGFVRIHFDRADLLQFSNKVIEKQFCGLGLDDNKNGAMQI